MQIRAELKGERAEEYLYAFVNTHRGLTIHELSKRLGWNAVVVQSIVKRLEKDGLIRINESEEGELKRKIYPVEWKDLLPEDVKRGFFQGYGD
jgi:DNA-binding MarR family transcriptional regulator